MAEFQVEGPELKKLVKYAKKQPIAFSFNPGSNEDEHYFGLHRKKSSKILGREAKQEGPGNKFAFGEMSVVGKEIHLKCERELPSMAKKLKRWLKKQKVMLNVIVMDQNGQVLEEDIEADLPDDPDLLDDDDELEAQEADAAQDDPEEQTDTAGEEDDAPGDAAQVAARLKGIADRIKAMPTDAGAKLAGPFKTVVQLAKSGDVRAAAGGADKLELALDKLEAASSVETGPGGSAGSQDPQSAKLLKAVETLRAQTDPIQDADRKRRILAALDQAETAAAGNKADQVVAILKKVNEAIKASLLEVRPETEAPDSSEKEWFSQYAEIEALVKEATALDGKINPDHPDLVEIARQWKWANDNAGDDPPDYVKAVATFEKIHALAKTIADAKAAGGADLNVSPEVKPFAEAQLTWRGARSTMKAELKKLQDEITRTCGDDPELAGIVKDVGSLADHIAALDERLEDALIAIVNAPQGDTRDKAKKAATGVLKEYRRELNSEFFKVVDTGNGFTNVSVAATAQKALDDIAGVLA